MKVKCFSFCALPKLASYTAIQFVACCGSALDESKAVFIKMLMAHKTHVISRNFDDEK